MSEKTNEYFNGDELASSVFKSKYAMKDEKSPDDMHKRMTKEFARVEKKYIEGDEHLKQYVDKYTLNNKQFTDLSLYGQQRNNLNENNIYSLFKDFKYIIPQGSIMYGLGRGLPISLSNCFVIGSATDSYGGIMLTDQEQVQLMKRRGGVGHDLSNLRPFETFVNNSAGTSTGAVSFAERYSNSTREVAQNGRRGK